MKRRSTLSIVAVLTVALVSLITFEPKVEAQNRQRFVVDTGLTKIGQGQQTILTISSGTPTANGNFNFRMTQMSYEETTCSGGVCKLAVASQTTSDPVTLMPGEAASIILPVCAFPVCGGFRAVVVSNSRDMKVNMIVRDTGTGAVISLTEVLVSSFADFN